MLKGIDPILSPELLKILAEMGHGDEIILADAHFPGATFCPQHVLRGDDGDSRFITGHLAIVELDAYADPLIMMSAEGDTLDSQVEADYLAAIRTVASWRHLHPCGLIGLLFMIVQKKPFRV